MGLFDALKAKADMNGDGKITKEDLESLKSPENKDKIEQLKGVADRNKDGKLDLSDAKGLDFGQLAKDAKGLFGK
jgi:hypothetical protein